MPTFRAKTAIVLCDLCKLLPWRKVSSCQRSTPLAPVGVNRGMFKICVTTWPGSPEIVAAATVARQRHCIAGRDAECGLPSQVLLL